jgi:serine/threonine protein kinase
MLHAAVQASTIDGGEDTLARTPLVHSDPAQVGRYRLTARLGAGGMGVVYLGVAEDGTPVAVKLLRPELADDPEFRTRFTREVSNLDRVMGVCTVRVIEADTESRQPFLVTEYADGPTLSEYVATFGPLPEDMLFGLATGLAEALTAIHGIGIVHRDLKPSNVLLTRSGPKVIDFGIAHTFDATSLTAAGITVGSAGFMAPEQVMGHAGTAADVFCWALTVAYAASGRSPFGAGAPDAIMFRILHADPDISAVPERIRPQVTAALAKDPHNRPSARDLLAKLTDTTSPSRSANATQTILAETWRPPSQGKGTPGVPWWQAQPATPPHLQQQQPQAPAWLRPSAAQQQAQPQQAQPQSQQPQPQQQHPAYHQVTLGPEEAAQALRQAQQQAAQQAAEQQAQQQAVAQRMAAARQAADEWSRSQAQAQLPQRPPARRRAGTITAAVILAIVLAAAGTVIGLALTGKFDHKTTPGSSGTPTTSATTTAGQAAAIPVLVVGSYSGTKPTQIIYSGDATNVVTGISWGTWAASGATGEGTSDMDSCVPSCAAASPDAVITKITLSDPVNGKFTMMTETRSGKTQSYTYPSTWAQSAS